MISKIWFVCTVCAFVSVVMASGGVAAAPVAVVSPDTFDFGSVEIVTSRIFSQTFTIENTGDEDLVIGALSITGADAVRFAIANDGWSGATLVPGATATVDVTFTPVTIGAKNAALSVPSNVDTVDVPLAGTGIFLSAAVIEDNGLIYTASSNLDGTFDGWQDIGIDIGQYCRAITLADFDNDGDLDIVAGAGNNTSVATYHYLENNGDGTFTSRGSVFTVRESSSYAMDITSGDFDGDGVMDVTANGNNMMPALFHGNGNGTFTFARVIPAGSYNRGIDAADFNHDGKLDFVRGSYSDGYLYVFLGDGTGFFTSSYVADVGSDPYAVVAGDFDNDGHPDILARGGSSSATYSFSGNGDGSFAASVAVPSLAFSEHAAFDAYDYNRDGNLDVIVHRYTNKTVWCYPGNGDGTFGTAVQISTSATGTGMAISAPPDGIFGYGCPTAVVSPASATVALGSAVELDASGSSDPDGAIVNYEWLFGDGYTDTGISVSHSYENEGVYTGRLTVTDNDGKAAHRMFTVTVRGQAPVAEAGGPYTFGEAEMADGAWTGSLDGTASSDAESALSYSWDFGDSCADDFADGDDSTWSRNEGTWTEADGCYLQGNASPDRTRNLFIGGGKVGDFTASVDVTILGGAGVEAHLIFRARDIYNNYEFLFRGRGYEDVLLYRRLKDTTASLAETNLPFAVEMGVTYNLKVVCQGASIKAYVDDVELISVTDSNLPGGYVGLSTYRSSAQFDNLVVASTSTDENPTHAWRTGPGTRTATLTVTDASGQTASDTAVVNLVYNDPPVADAGGPYTVGEDKALGGRWSAALDGSASTDDVAIADYEWQVESDDFTGTTLNDRWLSAGATQDEEVAITSGGWGTRYLFSKHYVYRDQAGYVAVQARLKPATATMFGFKKNNGDFSYTQMPHALYFTSGKIYVYENGSSRGAMGYYYTSGEWYDARVEMKPGSGARYYYRPAGAADWILVYDSTYSSDTELMPGLAVNAATVIDDFHVILGGSAAPTAYYYGIGTYDVALTVTDRAGQTDTASTTVTVNNGDPPVANAGPDINKVECHGTNGTWTVDFDGSASTDDFGIWRYEWDFGDGSPVGVGSTISHVYGAVGTYTVTLTVYDNALQTSTDTLTLTITAGDPPVANPGGPYEVQEADVAAGTATVTVDGSASADDCSILRYTWDFGTETFDGVYLDKATWRHSYQVYPGVYGDYVTIWGTGTWGHIFLFTQYNAERLPGLIAQASVCVSGNAMFGFKNTSTNFSYTQMPYALQFTGGNLVVYEDNTKRDTVGTYTQGSWYDVMIELVPTGGARYYYREMGQPDWTLLYTSSYVTASTQLKTGLTVASGTCHVDNFRLTAAGETVAYPVRRPTDVTLTVLDQAGQTNSASTALAVTGSDAPHAEPGGPYAGSYEMIIQFDGTGSTDDNGVTKHLWDFGDGSPFGSGPTPTHAYAVGDAAGSVKTVALTVYDAGGHSDTRTTTITLAPGPKVICVPWQFSGGVEVPHSTWSGESIRLKGIVKGGIGTLTYRWAFGDGSADATGTVSNTYAIEASHTYTGSEGALFTARLTVTDSEGNSHSDTYPVKIHPQDLDTKVDVAIDEGLWWLHKNIDRGTDAFNRGRYTSYGTYFGCQAGSAIQAFLINGHREVGDPAEDPYVETIREGMGYLFRYIIEVGVDNETNGDPDFPYDGTGNGIGLCARNDKAPYEGGMIMDGIVAGATPGRIAWTGCTNVIGRTYKEILQDMIDAYAWGQYDNTSTVGGGWRYSWNSGPDNSACQWAAIGIIPATRTPWFCSLPEWVRQRNDVWLNYSYHTTNRWFGYTSSTLVNHSGYGTRPSGMVQMVMSVDDYKSDPRWIGSEGWFADNWSSFINSRGYYAWYAFVKAMRLSETATLSSGFNWYRGTDGIAERLVSQHEADGTWPATGHTVTPSSMGDTFASSWAIIMLTSSLFELPPVAEAGSDVVWGYDVPLTFDASRSYHLDPDSTIELYEWDFDGDGTYDYTGTNPVVEHTFAFDPETTYPMVYVSVLRVTDNNGLTDTDTRSVTIAQPPHAPFAIITGPTVVDQVARGTAGLPVNFDATTSYDIDPGDYITQYDWIFDNVSGTWDFDSPDSQLAVDTHVYTAPGTYHAGLRVWDNGVLNPPDNTSLTSSPAYLTIEVEDNLPPTADAGGPYVVDEGTPLTLAGAASDPNLAQDPLTIEWDLDGDGQYDDATGTTPTYTWTANGAYTIALRVSDGLLTAIDTADLTVNDLAPTAEFAWSPPEPGESVQISFSDQSTTPNDPIVAWAWDFAGLDTSDQQNPAFTFADNGSYDVTLTVTDSDGSTDTITKTVVVSDLSPTAAFTWTAQTEGTPIQFTDLSTTPHDPIVMWSWDFGGLGSSSDQNPGFLFAESGTYAVTLTVIDADGSVDSITKNVVVGDLAPVAEFTWSPDPQNEGSPVQFTDQSTTPHDPIVSWSWNFGGLGSSTDQNPSFTFMQHGPLPVTLTVRDSDGSTSAVTHTVTILDKAPTARFAWAPDPQAEGSPVQFTDLSTSPADLIVSWSWGFAGLGSSVERNPKFTFPDDGVYTVTLVVTDSDGSTDTVTHDVNVYAVGPTARTDRVRIAPNGTATAVNVLANDLAVPAGETVTITGKTDGAHGVVAITGGGTGITYEPAAGYKGLDSFTYTITDDDGLTATATVFVSVIWSADVSGDCRVNILDLIQVRNYLGKNINDGNNRWYDVNVDGAINVLDLIYVRNRLGQVCP
ncbi:MAG TPA: PKD domain-containing protein [Planctomycetota bacterium]|nr:PKD domain-containing protein [Planctomycetota bacterium]